MKKVVKKKVDEKLVSYLERLSYEYEMCKDNVLYLINSHKDDAQFLDSDVFKYYEEKQLASKYAFENGKREFAKKVIPEELEGHKINWEIDFASHILQITQLCDCEVLLCGEE